MLMTLTVTETIAEICHFVMLRSRVNYEKSKRSRVYVHTGHNKPSHEEDDR